MAVITLTTEWRPDDVYNGIIKGKLSSKSPGTPIIDNACNLPPFNIAMASFVIRNTFNNYPKGSVHIICVHSEAAEGQGFVAVRARDHFFVGTDNGIFNLILNSEPEEVVTLDNLDSTDELEVFAVAAAGLIMGNKLAELGKPLAGLSEKFPLRATIDKEVIIGSIIFIDSYGNAISNITREVFYRVFEDKPYRILIQSNKNYTDSISVRYSDVPVGDMLARFNQLDLLEIAINGANVSELLSISVGSVVRIDVVGKASSPHKLF
jgi:S-adenosyl-L-methionine hydrolase (adenosine-forming)